MLKVAGRGEGRGVYGMRGGGREKGREASGKAGITSLTAAMLYSYTP